MSALCSNIDAHTVQPESYIAWHAWAETMSKTHRQERCSGCGLYAIWMPKSTGDGCRVCGVAVSSAELCDACAVGNDPFVTSKYAEVRA